MANEKKFQPTQLFATSGDLEHFIDGINSELQRIVDETYQHFSPA